MKQRLFQALPGGVILLAASVLVASGIVTADWLAPLHTYIPVMLIGAGLLGLGFRRARIALAVLAVATAYLVLLKSVPSAAAATDEASRYAANFVALLLPLNLALIAVRREQGLHLGPTLSALVMIAAQPLVGAFLWASFHPGLVAFLARPVTSAWAASVSVPLPALVAFVLSAWTAIAMHVWRPDAVQAGLGWTIAAWFAAYQAGAHAPAGRLFIGASALIMVAAAVQATVALAFRDALTGLPNRRALEEALAHVAGPCVAAMFDVDHFKGFNDRYGHDVGDQVLRMVAARLARVGGGGRAFRYGGEEFAVLFPGRTVKEVEPHLEAVRQEIEASRFTVRAPDRPAHRPQKPKARQTKSPTISVTVSAGAAARRDASESTVDLLRAADAALYRAKNSGRNRVCT